MKDTDAALDLGGGPWVDRTEARCLSPILGLETATLLMLTAQ